MKGEIMSKLTPYLMFDGDCEEAINFYQACFDGEIGQFSRYGDSSMDVSAEQKDKIMHVPFYFWAGMIMASDKMKNASEISEQPRSNIHLNLTFDDPDKMMNTFNKLKEGGQVTMKLEVQFWGDFFGMLTDKFSIQWMFNCPKKK